MIAKTDCGGIFCGVGFGDESFKGKFLIVRINEGCCVWVWGFDFWA